MQAVAARTPQPVYRFWSPRFGNAHFFTISADEAAHVRGYDPNWIDEGIAFGAYPLQNGTCPTATAEVYRFYSAAYTSHFFTISVAEKDHLIAADPHWAYEGVAYCAPTTAQPGTVPLYRFWSPRFAKHFYTANPVEAHQLDVNDPAWNAEGIAYYVIPPDTLPTTEPPHTPGEADASHPDHVIGNGTPASCTSDAVVAAVAAGGVITFNCGPSAVTITMAATAKVRNDHPDVVIDGGGLVTLSGGDVRRILYQNTCDKAQVWTTSHCQDQDHPHLTVQHLTFADGNSTGETAEGGGGGAIFVRGGRFTVVDTTFRNNTCDATGPDLGGAALRVLSQYHGEPVQVIASRFTGGRCSNGSAISSIGVSWVIQDSVMTFNEALGRGANPARSGTPGGGSGGAIYADGNTFTIRVVRTLVEDNHAPEGGGAIFFVSNDRTGTLTIEDSVLRRNPSDRFQTSPGIFYLGATAQPVVTGSTIS